MQRKQIPQHWTPIIATRHGNRRHLQQQVHPKQSCHYKRNIIALLQGSSCSTITSYHHHKAASAAANALSRAEMQHSSRELGLDLLQGKQIQQHQMPSITTRHGGRRRPPQGQGQSQGQAHATAPMQQQASLSRLESNNLIDSSNMNVNGAALLTGLGEPYESLMQSCGPLSVTCIVMWSLISHLHRHMGPCQSFVQSSGVVSVACTVLGCSIRHMLGHVVPYQSFAHSCPLS